MNERVEDHVDLVGKRIDVLRALEGDSLDLRAIEDRTGSSRATVNRAVRSLEDAGLVETAGGEYALTAVGRLALEHHSAYRRQWADLLDAKGVLSALDRTAPVDMDVVVGSEAVEPPESMPYRPVERLQSVIESADRYRGVLPKLGDPREFRLLYEHVATDGDPAELVVSDSLRSSLAEQFPRRLATMAGADGFELFVGDVPEVGVVLTERDGATTVTVVVYGDQGTIAGVVQNDTPEAVRWAEDRYERVRADGDPVTEPLEPPADGGVVVASEGPAGGGPGLPVRLERQGFVRLDRGHLVDESVADPTVAWRAGLDLAEVHAGYAIERTREDGTAVTESLTDELSEGKDCVLVGPPGSGKSTVAKRVACRWYDDDRGPVLYRERGRGLEFDAVGELAATVAETDGHVLVVVEDAVRPEAAAAFRAADRLADRDDVSFLYDARDDEWSDPPGDASAVEDADLAVEPMPPLSDADYERLVEQFEATTDVSVDLSVDRLRSEVRRDRPDSETTAPSEAFLLTHRLSLHATDPLDGVTSLDGDVASLYDELAEAGSVALDVGVLANTLVAAGVAPTDAHLFAVTDDHDAVRVALDALDGRVLFEGTDRAYDTVHETWSVAFLAHVLDEDEAAARDRFARATASLLALADRADERDRIRPVAGGEELADRVEADPAGWADEMVERLFALGRERPKLAGLFGDGDGPVVHLPAACTSVTPTDCRVWLGRTFSNEGDFERAMAVFETDPDDPGVEWLLGKSEAAHGAGEMEQAETLAERALAAARERDDDRLVARSLHRLGEILQARDDYDASTDRLCDALSLARELDDRRLEARCLHDLGNVAFFRGEYDDAREYYGESAEIKRAIGDRRGESKSLGNLGTIANFVGDWETAREYHERSLAIARAVGDRRNEAVNLANLGGVADHQGALDDAREYHERSLEIKEAIDHRYGMGHSLESLGSIAAQRGDYDRAMEYYRRALSVRRDIDDRRGESVSLYQIGEARVDMGDYELARQRFRESYDLAEEIDDPEGEAAGLLGLGKVALETGAIDRAEDRIERAIATFEEMGIEDNEAKSRVQLGRVALERGNHDRAREILTAALSDLDDCNVQRDALDAVERLVELERRAGDPGAAREWCDRALSRIDRSDYDLSDRREDFEALRAELDVTVDGE